MNEEQLYEILQSYKSALDALIDQNERLSNEIANLRQELTERVDSVEKTLFDDILTPAKEAISKASYENRFDEFNANYGSRLDPLVEQARAIEGDEYDLKREVFDNYDKMEEKPEPGEYVDTVVEAITNQIEVIKVALGADEVTIQSDENGDTTIVADGKDVTDEAEEIIDGGAAPGENGEGELPKEEIVADYELDEDFASPEEIEELEKELSAYK